MPMIATFAAASARGFRAGAAVTPWTIAKTDNAFDSDNQTVYSAFTGKSFGSAAANRKIAVLIGGNGASPATVTGVTIGGVAGSSVVQAQNGNKTSALFIAEVPSGTTGDVVPTFSAARVRCSIVVFAIYGNGSITAFDTASATSNPLNDSLNIPAGGVALAGACDLSTGAATGTTWTNLTERSDATASDGAAVGSYSAAADAFASAESARSITATLTGGADDGPTMVMASFGP